MISVSILSGYRASSQCNLTSEVFIADFDTTVFSFVVEGAIDNNLATNSICGIRMVFRHEFIGDLNLKLRSPAGQEIQLLGPAIESAPNTFFVRWDVTIVPCGFTAIPDQGLSPVWNNLNNWFQFRTYEGSYYPFIGCLEDLNTGPVNGVWTIVVEDVVEFGGGLIEEFTLIFCNPAGFDCTPCLASGGSLVQNEPAICKNSAALQFIPEVDFAGNTPGDDYSYRYLVYNEDGFLFDGYEVDLRNFPAGDYEICGLSLLSEEETGLALTPGLSKTTIMTSIVDQLGCYDVSSNCITITIVEAVDTITIDTLICLGDVLLYEGVEYSEAGQYLVGYSGDSCQTATLIDLSVYQIEAVINGGDQMLSCQNNEITLSGVGSTAEQTLTYAWYKEEDGERVFWSDEFEITVSETGTYVFEVESNGCVSNASVEVQDDGSFIVLNFDHGLIDCNQSMTTITTTANKEIVNINWQGPAGFSSDLLNIEVSLPGLYFVEITDIDGCVTQDSVLIRSDAVLETPTINPQNITCDRTAIRPNVELSDTSGLQFEWSNTLGFSSTFLNPLITKPGFYFLDITGENGCTARHLVTIFDDRAYPQVSTSVDPIDCNFSERIVTTTSDIQNVTYSWSGPDGFASSGQNPVVRSAGTYFVTVTTEQGCSTIDTLTVVEDGVLPNIFADDIVIRCSDNGEVRLTVDTDANNPSFQWTGPGNYMEFGPDPIAQTIGTYTVIVTGSNGCARSAEFEVMPGDNTPDISINSDPVSCDSSTVRIVPSNLNLTYEYTSPSGIVYTIADPRVDELGEYIVRVEDTANGCFATYTHEVAIDTVTPILNFEEYEINCLNENVRIQYMSNINLRSFEWSGPDGFSSNLNFPVVSEPGIYFLNVTAQNGCTNSFEVLVTDNFDSPDVETSDQFLTCENEEIALGFATAENGLTFEWTGPNGFTSTLTNPLVSMEGLYQATATGANGCVSMLEVTVTYDTMAPVLVSAEVDGVLSCLNEMVILSSVIEGTVTDYRWLDSDNMVVGNDIIFSTSISGEYTLVITAENGCTEEATVLVTEDREPPEFQVENTDINCNSNVANVEVIVMDPYESLTWNGPFSIPDDVLIFSTNQIGIYSVRVVGLNGCDSVFAFDVVEDFAPPSIDSVNFSDLNCSQSEVDLALMVGSQGSSFSWTTPDGTILTDSVITVNTSGLYSVTVEGNNGCETSTQITVGEDFRIPVIEAVGGSIDCIMTRVRINVSSDLNPASILWNGPDDYTSSSDNPLVLLPGIYNVTVTAENGCEATSSAEVIDNIDPPVIDLPENTLLFCDGSGVNLTVEVSDPNAIYNWFGPELFFSNEARPFVELEGLYYLYLLGDNGCLTVDSTLVILDTRLPAVNVEADVLNCVTTEVVLTAQTEEAVFSYEWKDENGFLSSASSLSISQPGNYTVVVTGLNLCVDSTSVQVTEDVEPPDIIIESSGIVQCNATMVGLDASASIGRNNIAFQWSTDNGNIITNPENSTIQIDGSGDYRLTVMDIVNGCIADTIIVVEEVEQQFIDFSLEVTGPSCPGFENGRIELTDFDGGTGPYMVSFDGGPFRERTSLSFLAPGMYSIVVRDFFGCEVSQVVTVPEPLEVVVDLGPDLFIGFGQSVVLEPIFNISLDGISFLEWSPPIGLDCQNCLNPMASPEKSITYELVVTDTNGCSSTDDIFIQVELTDGIVLPNVFAPESNTGNDVFYIGQTEGIQLVQFMSIYDRWGNRVFHSQNFPPGDPSFGWDGNFRGQRTNSSVFAVVAELLMNDGRVIVLTTDLTLVR